MYYSDPAQPLTVARQELDDVDDVDDLSVRGVNRFDPGVYFITVFVEDCVSALDYKS